MSPADYTYLFEKELAIGPSARYDSYKIELIQLNQRRQQRWNKTMELLPELSSFIKELEQPLKWILITEPWCGDSAPIFPFLERLTLLNPLITFEVNLRDSEDSMIDLYLSNGSKAIPKLLVQDNTGNDLFTWGSRSKELSRLVEELKNSDLTHEEQKIAQQKWYNQDKGRAFQIEFLELLKSAC